MKEIKMENIQTKISKIFRKKLPLSERLRLIKQLTDKEKK